MLKKCTPLWREAHLEVKSVKARHSRITFVSRDVEKVHAVVAQSTFWVAFVAQSTFWVNANITTHWGFFGSWDVETVHTVVARSKFPSKHVQNTWGSDPFLTIRWRFDVKKVHAVVARSTFGNQMSKTAGSEFCCVRCRFVHRYTDIEQVGQSVSQPVSLSVSQLVS